MKYYIYTIPKSGTYFFAELLQRIGLFNTGWHIDIFEYLDTKKFDLNVNSKFPSNTSKVSNYISRWSYLKNDQFFFGHISPMVFPTSLLDETAIIYAYRNPKKVLASEFVDFRFRRADVDFVNKGLIKNDLAAFEVYLKHHGPEIKRLFNNFILFEKLIKSDEFKDVITHDFFIKINFDDMLSKEKGMLIASKIAVKSDSVVTIDDFFYDSLLQANTKTNSKDVSKSIDRSKFWTKKALSIYKDVGFGIVEEKLKCVEGL